MHTQCFIRGCPISGTTLPTLNHTPQVWNCQSNNETSKECGLILLKLKPQCHRNRIPCEQATTRTTILALQGHDQTEPSQPQGCSLINANTFTHHILHIKEDSNNL